MVLAAFGLAACEGRTGNDTRIVDAGIDGGPLEDGRANIWVSPDGCQYWYIDDGLEGYFGARLNRDGTPRCTGQEDARTDIVTKEGTRIAVEPEPQV